jgi:hypothetical protein
LGELYTDFGKTTTDESSTATPTIISPFHKYRGSVAWIEGFEKNLHILCKNQYSERAMGVFTSGGDAQGR